MKMKGICPITGFKETICKSHIFPKFIYEHLKKTGGNRFIDCDNPTMIYQDGIKCYLLGRSIENEFSKRENWFARNIFRPYITSKSIDIDYSQDLYYFAISLIWRITHFQTLRQNNFKKEYPELERLTTENLTSWKKYLQNPHHFCDTPIYILPIDVEDIWQHKPFFEIDFYVKRTFDTQIFCSDTGDRVVYCKFAHFIIWAVISDSTPSQDYGIRIRPDSGHITYPCNLELSSEIIEYIFHRIEVNRDLLITRGNNMSLKQKEKLLTRISNDEHLNGSELGFILSQPKLPTVEHLDESTTVYTIYD